MKTMWWLSVFFFVNGQWQPGAQMEGGGWAPRAYESEALCQERRAFAAQVMDNSREGGKRIFPNHWLCSPGEPPTAVDLPPPAKAG